MYVCMYVCIHIYVRNVIYIYVYMHMYKWDSQFSITKWNFAAYQVSAEDFLLFSPLFFRPLALQHLSHYCVESPIAFPLALSFSLCFVYTNIVSCSLAHTFSRPCAFSASSSLCSMFAFAFRLASSSLCSLSPSGWISFCPPSSHLGMKALIFLSFPVMFALCVRWIYT